MIVEFDSGLRVVYKPRSLHVDRHFRELLQWIDDHGEHPRFMSPKIVDRDTYGWAEYIEDKGCASPEELWRFYERQGGYLALLYALEATDFHYENLIASGEHPVLIDLEALFQPRVGSEDARKRSLALAAITMGYSVLRIGLLPQRLWQNDQAEGIELSGLGGAPGQVTPHSVLSYQDAGTDEMRLIRKRVRMPGGKNRPTLNGDEVDIAGYIEAVVAGFINIYRLIVKERSALLSRDGPLEAFAEDEIRAVLRPTRTYGLLMQESYHPDMLRDAIERDRLFDRLWVGIEDQPYLSKVIRAEQADLRRGDIPLFTTRPCSRELWSSSNERIPEVFVEPSMSVVRRRLREMSEDDLSRQSWFIRASLTSLIMGKGQESWKGYDVTNSLAVVTRERLLCAAQAVADRIEVLSLRDEEVVAWIGVTFVKEREWSLLPLGGDLYNGALGVITFLAYVGTITKEERYTALAKAALATIRRQMEPLLLQTELAGTIGGFGGWGGLIYTLTQTGVLWSEPEFLAEAEGLVDRIAAVIGQDQNLDIISGTAGFLATVLSLYECSPSERTLEAAIRCGDHLIAHAQRMDQGIGWLTKVTEARQPLTGFSHGAAGIAWVLLKLAACTGEARFKMAAMQAIEYERSVFSPEMGNWPDFRELAGKGDLAQNGENSNSMVAWCHGAPGIGLARLASLVDIDDAAIRQEISTALRITLKKGFGLNHSLCHGDLGNLELLLQASLLLDEPEWQAHVTRIAGSILDSIDSHGWLCGVPFGIETPGLMTGLSGIGYQLLRLAEPLRVPSILMLAPPPAQEGDGAQCRHLNHSDGQARSQVEITSDTNE